MQVNIANDEDEEEDDTDHVAHIFKELLIDTPQDLLFKVDITIKSFITKLGLFQNIESTNTINTLVDDALKHLITYINTTVPHVNPMSYSFTTSNNLCYNNYEFKGLMIDSGKATRSTGGIG